MFTSRRNHIHKTKELTMDGDPEALIYLYQLTYVSINNELLKQGFSDDSIKSKTIYGLMAFWDEFKEREIPDNFAEEFESKVIQAAYSENQAVDQELQSYLMDNAEPSVRSNIWSKSWSIVSAIIVFLAFIGLMLNECSG